MYSFLNRRQINKTIDVNETSHLRTENQSNFYQKYSWVMQDTDYKEFSDQQIYRQYEKLRKQIFNINDLVVKQLQKFNKNVQKKRLNTEFQMQKTNQVREKEIQNNLNILQRMKKQYKGLKQKSQTITPKQDIQREIQNTKSEINNVKKKINTLKLKNKDIGDNILGTDQILIQLQQAQRQLEVWQRKKSLLQSKLQKVQLQQSQISQNLGNMNHISVELDQFQKKELNFKRSLQTNKKNFYAYQQKMSSIKILQRNIQVWTGMKQKRYHQLLKQFDNFVQKQNQKDQKINEVSLSTISSINEIASLQAKLKIVKQQNSKMGVFQNLACSIQSNSVPLSNVKRNIKLNSEKFNEQQNIPTKRINQKQVRKQSLQIPLIEDRQKTSTNIRKQSNQQENKKVFLKQQAFMTLPKESSARQNFLEAEKAKSTKRVPLQNEPIVKKISIKSDENINQSINSNRNQREINNDKYAQIKIDTNKKVVQKTQEMKELPNIPKQRKLNQSKEEITLVKKTKQINTISEEKLKQEHSLRKSVQNDQPEGQIEQQNQLEQQITGKFYIDLSNIQKTIDEAAESRMKAKKDLQTRISQKLFQPQSVPEDESDIQQNQ